MPWFIKTEQFTEKTLELSPQNRALFLEKHKCWVEKISSMGWRISSGYLVDKNKVPGGGGVLIVEADSYEVAMKLIQEDPMIIEGLVSWNIQEWIPVSGNLIN